MLRWDSDDESVGDMTRVSDALGGAANADTEHAKEEEGHIDEMELLQLRNLVQQIKLQTVIGDNFMKGQDQGYSSNLITNPLEALVTPITEEDVEDKYRQLVADHNDLLEEREQLHARINQFKMMGGEDKMQGGSGGEDKQGGGHITEKLRRAELERDVARRETEAAKIEVDNLKICQRNLEQFYQDKVNEMGLGGTKTSDSSATVPLEEYNKLKELHFALNLQHQQSEISLHQMRESLHEANSRAQFAEQELNNIRYSRMFHQPTNNHNINNQAGASLLGNPVWQQILQMNQQMNGRR